MDFIVLHLNVFGDCEMCYICQYIEIVLGICSIIIGTRHIITSFINNYLPEYLIKRSTNILYKLVYITLKFCQTFFKLERNISIYYIVFLK